MYRVNKEIPAGVKGWSWGAFLLNWMWAVGNKTWWGLLAVVPYLGFFVALYLGFKGRELAWKNKDWTSYEDFDATQKKWSFWGVSLFASVFIIGILFSVALPAYQDYKQKLGKTVNPSAQNSEQKQAATADYGFGIKSHEEYSKTVNNYREKIKSGEIHVFDSTPVLHFSYESAANDKPWPKSEVSKIDFLWWAENDYIYMVISNQHPRIPIRGIILGANHGACGTTAPTSYPIDLNVDIQPVHFAIVRLSNELLFRYAYQKSGRLNNEEQIRWGTGRESNGDCFSILDAWFGGF